MITTLMKTPETFMKSYESALATQNWQSVAPLMDENVSVTFSNGTFFTGKANVQKAFEKNFALIQDEKYSISEIHWVEKRDRFAVCLYTFHWSGLINGKPASGSGRGTSVLIQKEGTWLVLAEHLGPGVS